ncbi:MAG: heavy metal translocating P-type ATPase [Lentisphaeria bacterium]|nr:heavy metal translocating P-type ATPase [Lentisphaeria bacterium]
MSSEMIDPICGMTVAQPPKISCRYNGKTYGFCCERCKDKFLADPEKALHPPMIDPICGMTVAQPPKISCRYNGKTYGFCCERCKDKFLADPEKALHPEPAAPAPDGTVYFCPMCPGVEQDHFGSCPVCGMDLEPKLSSGGIAAAQAAAQNEDREFRSLRRKFVLALALTVIMLVLKILLHMQAAHPGWQILSGGIITTLLLAWPARFLLKRGVDSVKTWHFNMFTLILLGIGTAWGVSLGNLIFCRFLPETMMQNGFPKVFFMEAAMIATLVLLGQMLESRARAKTSEALRALLDLAPPTARKVCCCGTVKTVPLDEIQIGDRIRVMPGDKVPLDGVILSGSGSIDKSLLTGEPVPEECSVGSQVISGTVNLAGSFDFTAEKVGKDTMLSRMISLVAEAQTSRPPARKLVDTVSAVFGPVVLICAIAAFAVWTWGAGNPVMGLTSAIAVLLIACPCALGLATPMSIAVAAGVGARAGILIRDAGALEVFRQVKTIVLDKTGTVTEGKPRLTEVLSEGGQAERDHLLAIAAAAENFSEHPFARAVVDAASERNLAIPEAGDFAGTPGKGIRAVVAGKTVLAGNAGWMQENNIPLAPQTGLDRILEAGQTPVYVAEDGRFLGILVLMDPIRKEAPGVIAALQARKVRVVLLSGDQQIAAESAAAKLGITEAVGNVLPEKKFETIHRLQLSGKTAMVGDGINDAAALAAADVGIAMGGGADVAMKNAGITLMGKDLNGIVKALDLSHALHRNIRQNLFFAFFYNILAVPVAAGVLYPLFGWHFSPVLGSLAMSLSSVSVITNALRLKRTAFKK